MPRPERPKEEKAIHNMIKGYLRPDMFHLFKAYQEIEELRQSEALNDIVRHFFNTMPEDRKQRVMQMKEQRRVKQMQGLVKKRRRRKKRQ